MRFDLKPWDRNRPRRNPPLAHCVVAHGGKTFGLRACNGILFFRDQNDAAKTWAIASPLPPEIESDPAHFEAFWRREFERGHVARYLAPLVLLHIFNKRQIPLFLRSDGTGWARESWNRDDVEFRHRVSLHEWLEGADDTLLGELGEVEDQLEEQLSGLDRPREETNEDPEQIEWACGSQNELEQVMGWACALETKLWERAAILRVQVEFAAENSFARAHLSRLRFLDGRNRVEDSSGYETASATDALTFVPEHVYEDSSEGWQTMTGQTKTPFLPSGRFFRLLDLSLDQNTPLGLGWQYTDQGAGRCADAPHAPTFYFDIKRPPGDGASRAAQALRGWLDGAVPASEIEPILSDEAPRDLPAHEWF